MAWTRELGDAVLAQRADVMDAVQRLRRQASMYGYLRSNSTVRVTSGPYVEILPVGPAVIPVPIYDPRIVFAPPRRGFAVSSAIRFLPPVRVGAPFAPWGWNEARVAWPSRTMIINRTPWTRTWANRQAYVHPFPARRFADSVRSSGIRSGPDKRCHATRSKGTRGHATIGRTTIDGVNRAIDPGGFPSSTVHGALARRRTENASARQGPRTVRR